MDELLLLDHVTDSYYHISSYLYFSGVRFTFYYISYNEYRNDKNKSRLIEWSNWNGFFWIYNQMPHTKFEYLRTNEKDSYENTILHNEFFTGCFEDVNISFKT